MASLSLSSFAIVMASVAMTVAQPGGSGPFAGPLAGPQGPGPLAGPQGPGPQAGCEVEEGYTQPHIIFFLADDLGFNDIGWNNDEVSSPYLTELASTGLILDRNYVQPVCSPSRSALQTGKFAFRLGVQHMVIDTMTPDCLDLEQTLIGETMQGIGYSTHMLGKWHLGFCNWECTPTYRGYDTFYGYYNGYVNHINHEIDEWYDWRDQEEPDTSNNGTYATDLLAERAAKLITEDDGTKPLFMIVAMATVHAPVQLPDGTTFEAGDDEREIYLGMVEAMDNDVKVVVEALKDKGYYDNSVIIFSSDNGGEVGGSSNYPLRGTKGSIYEGGTRVPAMVHSPLQTATGIKSEETFSIVDWYPTMVELGGGCADETQIDGLSQVDMIMNGGATRRNEHVYNIDPNMPPNFGYAAIRIDDYKLIKGFPGLYDGWEQDGNLGYSYALDLLEVDDQFVTSHRRKRSDYVLDFNAIGAYAVSALNHNYLFNVMDDPEERTNLAAEYPDIVASMTARLEELIPQSPPFDPALAIVVPAAKSDEYNGIWTPGWC